MSVHKPSPNERHGLDLEVPLVHPVKLRGVSVLAGISLAFVFAGLVMPRHGAIVLMCGLTLLGLAAWTMFVAVRIQLWDGFVLRLTRDEVTFPSIPAWHRNTLHVALANVEDVGTVIAGQGMLAARLTTPGAHYLIPIAWLPKSPPGEIPFRILVRAHLRRSGKSLSPEQLAAVEAVLLAPDDARLGAVVVEKNGIPRVLATVGSVAEWGDAMKGFSADELRDRHLVVCDDLVAPIGDAVRDAIAPPRKPERAGPPTGF